MTIATMPRGPADHGVPTLSTRALNRALLGRQLLLERTRRSPLAAIERLVGLQAQSPQDPYLALWSRLEDFTPASLSRAIAHRKAVRLAMMRSTIHLVTRRDCLELRPVVQRAIDRSLNGTFGKRLSGLDLETVAGAGRALVDERPRTLGEIGTLLARQLPGRDPLALANAVRALVPLVQPPPRGLWRASGQATHTSAAGWLGVPLETDTSPDRMLLRYLAAFGPASVVDAQVWSLLPRLKEAFERLRPRLRTFRDEKGRELFDIRNGVLPDPDTPAPPRFLPEYDNVFLSHADRSRIASDALRTRTLDQGRSIRMVLVDGFLSATWDLAVDKTTATLTIAPFVSIRKSDRTALAEEGERLAAFLAPESTRRQVRFAKV